jgi:PAS domain-containing protein
MGRHYRQGRSDLWRERYRVLFDRNVAGVILTDVEGRITDCNEPCARINGFESRDDMLARSAWDFYFDRTEREALIDHLRSRRSCPGLRKFACGIGTGAGLGLGKPHCGGQRKGTTRTAAQHSDGH